MVLGAGLSSLVCVVMDEQSDPSKNNINFYMGNIIILALVFGFNIGLALAPALPEIGEFSIAFLLIFVISICLFFEYREVRS